jgi:hypothetical protein
VGIHALQLGVSARYPTVEDVTAAALSILGSAAGSGVSGVISHQSQRARDIVIAQVVQNLMQGMGQEGGDLLRAGDLSAGEIADRLARRAVRDVLQGTISGLREAHSAGEGAGGEAEAETETDEVRSRRARSDEEVLEAATGRRRAGAGEPEGNEVMLKGPNGLRDRFRRAKER